MILILETDLATSAKRLSDRDLHDQLYILMDCWLMRENPASRATFRFPALDLQDLNSICHFYLEEWRSRYSRFSLSALSHPLADVGLSSSIARQRSRLDLFEDYLPHHRGFARYLGELDRLKKRARLHIGKHSNLAHFLAEYNVGWSGRHGRGYSSPQRLQEAHERLNIYDIPRLENHYDQYYPNLRLFNSYTGPGL